MVFENNKCKAVVVGVGGAGCNVVDQIYKSNASVDTIAINTDKQVLHSVSAGEKLYICKEVLHGEGASGDVKIGKKCAEIHKEEIRQALSKYDMVFVVSGLGGGTGTGATPAVIEAAQSQNILTFAISIKPFFFEGDKVNVAREGYNHIRSMCPNTMAIENDMILSKMPDATLDAAFREVNSTIMDHVNAFMDMYKDTIVRKDKMYEFDSAVRSSPLYAFTSA